MHGKYGDQYSVVVLYKENKVNHKKIDRDLLDLGFNVFEIKYNPGIHSIRYGGSLKKIEESKISKSFKEIANSNNLRIERLNLTSAKPAFLENIIEREIWRLAIDRD